MTIISNPSPNCDTRAGCAVDMIVLHYTGMKSTREAVARLCDTQSKVSAHYVVDDDGAIYRLVAEEKRAWHAGVSAWRGHTNINQRSIGIELANPGHEFGYKPFKKDQMAALMWLCKDILSRHPIPARNIVGHADIAPTRKEDPGELFDWKWLFAQGIGLWPAPGATGSPDAADLAKYGYDTTDRLKAIIAFQRHFRPKSITSVWDEECASLLAGLLSMV